MKFSYAIFGTAALSLAACADMSGMGKPSPEVSESLVTATATIDSVDKTDRIVQLHGDETGRQYTVYANDGIKNLDQLEAGDIVVMEYYEATTLSMATPESPEASTATAAAEASQGELPGGIAVQTDTLLVEVVSYDRETGIATFRAPDGLLRQTVVQPRLRSFAERTQRGDIVEVTMTQAVAISIDEVES